jgi:hypothetical protein
MQDPPVKSRFHFSISIDRSLSGLVAKSSMNIQGSIWLDRNSFGYLEQIRYVNVAFICCGAIETLDPN